MDERPNGIERLGEAAAGETEHATTSSARKKGKRIPVTGRGRAQSERGRDSEGGGGVEDEARASSALWETGGCTAWRAKENIAEVAITNDSAKNKVRSRRKDRARPAEGESSPGGIWGAASAGMMRARKRKGASVLRRRAPARPCADLGRWLVGGGGAGASGVLSDSSAARAAFADAVELVRRRRALCRTSRE